MSIPPPAGAGPEPHAFVVGRVPLFAAAWATSVVTWSAVLIAAGVALAPLVGARAAEAAVLVAIWMGARRTRTEHAASLVVAGGCVLLGWVELALFVWTT